MENSVGFATFDWAIGTKPLEPNGCAWYRCVLPMRELEKYDWRTQIGAPEYTEKYGFGVFDIENQTATFVWDIIVFKLVMLKKAAELLKDPNRIRDHKIVVDVDDWYEGLQESNFAYNMTDPEKHPENNRECYLEIIDNADAIITSTQFLYDYYKSTGKKNVFLVRNAIDLPRWVRKKDYARALPTVGWVGAVPWRSNDLETLDPFFGEFMEKNRLPFHHAGHIKGLKSADERLGIPPSVKVTYGERKIISQYPTMFRKIDIGIVPLNDIPFNYAKSGIKGLEYVASGIPYVASWSPEYEYLENLGIGRVARTPDEWIQHLTELQDPKIRQEDSDRNYENVKLTQTMEVRGKEWNEVMHQILAI